MAKSKTSSGFPIFKWILFAILGFAIAFAVQIKVYGSLRESPTGQVLKSIGVLEEAEATWKKVSLWTSKNVPVYYEKIASSHYFKKGSEYALIGYKNVVQSMNHIYSFIIEKLPFIGKWVDTYAPSKATLMKGFDQLSQYSKVFLQFCLKHGIRFANIVMHFSVSIYDWLLKNVFVGDFSSEKLQRYAVEGINATYNFASQTYFWVQDKFITLYT